MILHCLRAQPDSATARRLLGQLAPDDRVLLLGEAVVLARAAHPELATWVATGARLHALQDDLDAHGVIAVAPEIRATDYAAWVALSEHCATQVMWR